MNQAVVSARSPPMMVKASPIGTTVRPTGLPFWKTTVVRLPGLSEPLLRLRAGSSG